MSLGAESLAGVVEDPLIGVRIEGRYRVQRVHSRGGTSVIYSAMYDERQREVAVKVLDASSAIDPDAVQRFEIEARMGVALAHDNVVSVSDFGRLADGRPFLVMPMITGMDMATLLAHQGPQHPRRVATLLKGVASALDLVHRRGCMHRDIKSENLMHVVHPGGSETAIVLDFGLASVRTSNATPDVDSSGTPEFMAPEALAGEPLDHRGDIYSLATVAFELMTGSLPFESDDLDDLRRKKATQPARTLKQAAQAEFPASIEDVIARALARDREQRQATASTFIRELETASDDMTVWPLPSAWHRRTSKYPTLVGTGARPAKRTQLAVAKRPEPVVSRTKTLTALADRAQRFSSSNPPPADAVARFSSSSPPPSNTGTYFSSSSPPPAAAERAQRFTSSTPAPPPLGGDASLPASALRGDASLPAPPRVPRVDAVPSADDPDPDTHVRLRPSPAPAAPAVTPAPGRATRVSRAKAKGGNRSISSNPPASTSDNAPALRGGAASTSDNAPALRGGVASTSDNAPALRGGASLSTPSSPAGALRSPLPAAPVPAATPVPSSSTPPPSTPPTVDPTAATIIVDPQLAEAPSRPPAAANVESAIARLAALEAEDVAAFRPPPRPKRRLLMVAAVAVAIAIAVVIWRRHPAATSLTSAAVSPSPASAAPAAPPPPPPVAAPAPAAEPAVPEASAIAPEAAAPAAAPEAPPEAAPEPERSAKSSSRSASSRSSKKTSASEKRRATAAPVEAAPAPEPKPAAPSGKADSARAKMLGDQAGDMMIRGDFAAAARAYQQAIGADAGYAPAWRGKGLALERMGKTRDAAGAFRQFLKLEPNGTNADKIRERLKALDASP